MLTNLSPACLAFLFIVLAMVVGDAWSAISGGRSIGADGPAD